MRECHIKFIASDNGGPRYEKTLTGEWGVKAEHGFEVFSALFGDGKSRYDNVTTTVREWGRDWPENWEEILYATRKPRAVSTSLGMGDTTGRSDSRQSVSLSGLVIHKAHYGVDEQNRSDVTQRLRNLVQGDTLDVVVNNSTIVPGQNPWRGKKKKLWLTYSFADGELVTIEREEKDWLIIGPVREQWLKVEAHNTAKEEAYKVTFDPPLEPEAASEILDEPAAESDEIHKLPTEEYARLVSKRDGREDNVRPVLKFAEKYCPYCGRIQQLRPDGTFPVHASTRSAEIREVDPPACKGSGKKYEVVSVVREAKPTTAAALNDYLIRKFSISPQRLRGPMPIELRDFHRNDLAQLFAELGFKRGAEIGVAEGNYSEVLLKANPECELLLVDPWHHYSDNPQGKSKERHEYAFSEVMRKTLDYKNVKIMAEYSMDAVQKVEDESLDFFYCDGNHLFDYAASDLIWWSKKLRSGGLACGDDYYALDQKRWVGGGVVEAVQAYVNAHRIPIWYIFQGHKSVDYLWVKP